jgi:hypothetical protein
MPVFAEKLFLGNSSFTAIANPALRLYEAEPHEIILLDKNAFSIGA